MTHKLYTFLAALLITATTFAQAPEKMSYQAVVRDAGNAIVSNQAVGMQLSILQDATAVYVETQTPTTNANGLVSIQIGMGSVVSGDFSMIDWSAGTYFIKTETDPTGGSTYTITGTSQLLSVPYALYASNGQDSGTNAGDMQYWNGSSWEVVVATPNEGAALQMIGGVPTWTGGTPPATIPDAPIIGTAVAADGQASIAYTAPFDGGSLITNYVATSSPGNITGTINQAVSGTINVEGLTNGTAYTFTITATNAIGISLASSASNSVTPSSQPQPPAIGDLRDGGVVFYIAPTPTDLDGDGTLDTGLVCALIDQSTYIRWYNGSNLLTGAAGEAIGTGSSNTEAIIVIQGNTDFYAAKLCKDLSLEGHNDWFLPSKDELNLMRQNIGQGNVLGLGNIGGFSNGFYWSSTEFSTNDAWLQDFGSGNQFPNGKINSDHIRSVRAF
ncbi:DUF1566 domain-containing protein [Psychroserpens jangbogonensis]|uniref:Lcl domain-containing protein n=1 Tax=Psychroserpens jangbogonensis TaxID=1484460 RepID=UPI0006908311|nr:DUF1566 domain-containing protein [Psychroserpens jangbogonensis]